MRDQRGPSKECSSLPSCSSGRGGQQLTAAAVVVVVAGAGAVAERRCPS